LGLVAASSSPAAAQPLPQADTFTITITRAARAPKAITADPSAAFWKDAPSVATSHDRYGKPVPDART